MAIDWQAAAKTAGDVAGVIGGAVSTYLPYQQLALQLEQAGAQKAAGIYQRGLFEVQAIDTLSLANIRADQEEKIATLQAGRRLQQANIEARNYQIQGNRLLRNLRATNAAVRARAAANGIDIGSGSAAQLQDVNTQTAMFDVGITDLNALMARVFGYEDATAMFITGKQTAQYTRYTAERQAAELRLAGEFAEKSGGLLSNAALVEGGIQFAQTVQNPFPTIAKAFE